MPASDWFWEGNVQQAVVSHIIGEGWTIEATADTASRARGVDILATKNGRQLAVEVKGFPGTTYARGPKAGQPKPTAPTLQARHWFAEAVLTTLLTRARRADHEVAIALPDMPRFRALLVEVEWALERLAIGVYLVAADGTVTSEIQHTRADRSTTRVVVPAEGVSSWRALLADPVRQWKSGYSAKALAHCWQEANGFPQSVHDVFAAFGQPFETAELVLAIPEHRVAFPGGSRASQTDLFAVARGAGELIAIAVEGKVAEEFDSTVGDWLSRRAADQAKRGRAAEPSARARKRLRFLCQLLDLDQAEVADLRYQLLHRTAAALLEANRFAAPHALMLVHSFSDQDAWLGDYTKFAARMGASSAGANAVVRIGPRAGATLYLAWVRGEEQYARI
jgi:Domain of unknown function (DUF6946)